MSADIFEGIMFGDPLTSALFDRTLEQREQHGRLTGVLGESTGLNGQALQDLADLVMYVQFLDSVNAAATAKAEELELAELPFSSGDALFRMAHDDVVSKVRVLHSALPLPMVERIGSQS